MSTYSQSRLTHAFFSGGEFGWGWIVKWSWTWVYPSPKEVWQSLHKHHCLVSTQKTSWPINWQARMQSHAKQSWKLVFEYQGA